MEFLREMELLRVHRPDILILIEPKISGEIATKVCKKLKKIHWILSEADGFSSGVWVLWDEDDIQVSPRYIHHQFIHMSIVSGDQQRWELTALYASPQASSRRQLWSALDQIAVNGAWALIEDFNCVLRVEEWSSGNGVSSSFIDWAERTGLIDLGFSGPVFTWNRGSTLETHRAARLDRGMCDITWRH